MFLVRDKVSRLSSQMCKTKQEIIILLEEKLREKNLEELMNKMNIEESLEDSFDILKI